MKPDSAFRRLREPRAPVRFTFEGRTIVAERGDSIAAALLAAGVSVTRTTPVSGAPRAPFCMMGSCFECLVSLDGVEVQGCMVAAAEGAEVRRIEGAPALST